MLQHGERLERQWDRLAAPPQLAVGGVEAVGPEAKLPFGLQGSIPRPAGRASREAAGLGERSKAAPPHGSDLGGEGVSECRAEYLA